MLDSDRCGRALAHEKSKKQQGKRKASFASESATKRPKHIGGCGDTPEVLLRIQN